MPFFIFIIVIFLTSPAHAINLDKEDPTRFQKYKGLKELILSSKRIPPLVGERPDETEDQKILRHPPVTNIAEQGATLTLCHDTMPHGHQTIIEQAGFDAQLGAAYAGKHIEHIVVQPRFSGLLGPSISFIRRDFENAVRHKAGSRAEIMHNARLNPPQRNICKNRFKLEDDIEYRTQIDLFDSDKSPLYRIDAIRTKRAYLGQNFMGSLGIKAPILRNLEDDEDLFFLDKEVSVGQDDIAFAYQSAGLDHGTFNGFFTLKTDLYLSAQIGYLEEKFAGIGGEILYRPFHKPWSIGFDAWLAYKRKGREGSPMEVYDKAFSSAFINGWYDMPSRPISLGLSLGQFLDGDLGGEVKALYKPSSGWRLEGFARYSNEADKSLDNNESTNLTAGMRLTIPMEQIKTHAPNSRMTTSIGPFGRDKRQRIYNAYPLYDLTDPWSAQNIYQNWEQVLVE